jgi:hypothetical protein
MLQNVFLESVDKRLQCLVSKDLQLYVPAAGAGEDADVDLDGLSTACLYKEMSCEVHTYVLIGL